MPNNLGIVTGLRMEAALLHRANSALRIDVAGLGEGRAAQAAERLIAGGAMHLLSFGIAGGIETGIAPGTVIVASEIRGPAILRCDPAWSARLGGLLGVAPVPLAHAAEVLATPEDKARTFVETRACAADMESYGVAEVAAAHGLPFAALRVVADTAADTIPSVALAAMSAEGRTKPLAAVVGTLLHPGQIPALIHLGRRTAFAMKALEASAHLGAARGFLRDE